MADEYTISKTDDGKLYLLRNGVVEQRLFRMKEALEKIGITAPTSVSYTHLTLPTKRIV